MHASVVSSSMVSIRFVVQRTGVLDDLLAHRAELRIVGLLGHLVGRLALQHAARSAKS